MLGISCLYPAAQFIYEEMAEEGDFLDLLSMHLETKI
jgi:hypothetical protein